MAEPENSFERRKLERFDLTLPATIEPLTPNHRSPILNLLTSDICSGGAFFETNEPLREGTPVRVDLVLSLGRLRKKKETFGHRARIKVTGRVLRAAPSGMAIAFHTDFVIRPFGPPPSDVKPQVDFPN